MENVMSNYLSVQRTIETNAEVMSMLEHLFGDSSSSVIMIKNITKLFPHENYLVRCWSHINEIIKSTDNIVFKENEEINDIIFYGCLYASITAEDEKEPSDSPVLITLTTLLNVGMLRSKEELLKEECSKVLTAGLKRLHTRDLMQWKVTSEFLYDCLKAIKTMQMDPLLINSFIHLLMIYAGKHFNMVNNLSLADNNSPVGVLAFACLANLLVKDCEDKQIIIETMLENIELVMDNDKNLSSFQVNVKQSNFSQMIRQIGNSLTTGTDQLFFGIIRVAERYPKSKTLVLIINQLPCVTFCELANVIVKLCYRKHYPEMQLFCFNMLESPYLTEEESEQDALQHVYQNIVEAIVLPIRDIEQLQTVKESLKLIYFMLQIQNTLVQKIILNLRQSHPIMKDLMTYINQYCHISWKEEYKLMNQYFISIYCRLVMLTKDNNNRKDIIIFGSLLLAANTQNLVPCIKDITALISSDVFSTNVEVQSVILNSLVNIVKHTSPQSLQLLKLLHDVIFNDLQRGIGYYDLIVLKTSGNNLLLKNMVKNKLITPKNIESLSFYCKKLKGWRILSELAIHMDFILSKSILNFTEHLHKMKLTLLKDTTIMYVTRFFSEILDRKAKACQPYEKECLQRFAVFLEGGIIKRLIPLHTLPLALITMRKYYNYHKISLTRLIAMSSEVEAVSCNAFKELFRKHGKFVAIPVIPRDLSYFAEMQLVFGDLEEFAISNETIQRIESILLYLPNIKSSFTHWASVLIKSITKIAIRNEDLLQTSVNTLCKLIKLNPPKIKRVCLDCLYDIALFRTSSYDVLIPYIYDLLTSNNSENAVTALNTYLKLLAKEHAIPNDWQTFTLALAISNEEVRKYLEVSTFEKFMEYLKPYFETYFIHIMFFSNEVWDNEDHFINFDYRKKIMTEKLSSKRRHDMYTIIIKHFTIESRSKILTYIYKKLSDKYLKQKNLNNLAFTEDILVVTYQALKNQNLDYPMFSKFHYDKTINQITKLQKYSAKKLGNGINVEEIITIIITKLVHLLSNLNEAVYHQLMQKLFHLILAIVDWNYISIFNAIVDEGMNGKLRKNILGLLELFRSYSHIFQHNEIENELQTRPTQSVCDRI